MGVIHASRLAQQPLRARAARGAVVIGSIGAMTLLGANAAQAEDLPMLRKGMWEFNRTMPDPDGKGAARTISSKRCTNPTEDMKRQNDMLAKSGCKLSPLTRSGKTYTFTSDCAIQGISAKGTSVITVETDSAYTVDVDTLQDGKRVKERMVARRVGDCP